MRGSESKNNCVQEYGLELWWSGDLEVGSSGDLQSQNTRQRAPEVCPAKPLRCLSQAISMRGSESKNNCVQDALTRRVGVLGGYLAELILHEVFLAEPFMAELILAEVFLPEFFLEELRSSGRALPARGLPGRARV
ncbi:hypothetical protein F511_33590 [Dorcoceras hygrometricum]|uniref:Uncharacterized protein n=1 Tax=Dorcoceras hygrometricum TaxID=472368 RepID=A0A2Z7D6R0_9LAMI|nr:hypothetical protein F511_33590 [Dorcoceras hygrometricum]